jgi:hypothetical protein
VLSVYVEATTGETEARVLHSLHKSCPELGSGVGLGESLAAVRRGHVVRPGQNVLLILDIKGRMRPEGELCEASMGWRDCGGVAGSGAAGRIEPLDSSQKHRMELGVDPGLIKDPGEVPAIAVVTESDDPGTAMNKRQGAGEVVQ